MAIKEYNGISYDTEVDYEKVLKDPNATDAQKRQAEKARNAKIDGEGLSQYAKTHEYTSSSTSSSSSSRPSQSTPNTNTITYGGVTFYSNHDYSTDILSKTNLLNTLTPGTALYEQTANTIAELVIIRQAKVDYIESQTPGKSSEWQEGYNFGLENEDVAKIYSQKSGNPKSSYYVTGMTYDFSTKKYSITIMVNRNSSANTDFTPYSRLDNETDGQFWNGSGIGLQESKSFTSGYIFTPGLTYALNVNALGDSNDSNPWLGKMTVQIPPKQPNINNYPKTKSVLSTGGTTNLFSYKYWNELCTGIDELLLFDKGAVWDTTYLSFNDTLMTQYKRTLTAKRFNSFVTNLEKFGYTGLPTVIPGNVVKLSYFNTIENRVKTVFRERISNYVTNTLGIVIEEE